LNIVLSSLAVEFRSSGHIHFRDHGSIRGVEGMPRMMVYRGPQFLQLVNGYPKRLRDQ
jgi:hypothetical protein